MGRFYKTAKPEMIDFMHKLPEKALFAAVDQADKQYEDVVKYVTDLEKYNKINAQESDVERRDELLKEVDAKIKDFTYQLHTSPSSARKSMGEIKQFGQKLHENYTRGEMAAIQAQSDAEEKFVKEHTERTLKETGKVLPGDVEAFREIFNEKYNKPIYEKIIDPETGLESKGKLLRYEGGLQWDPTTNKGKNSFYTENLANYQDSQKYLIDLMSGWKPDTIGKTDVYLDGNYLRSTETNDEVANYNDIYNSAYKAFIHNPEQMQQYQQKMKYGLLDPEDFYGLRDEEDQLIMRTTQNEKGEEVLVTDEWGNPVPVKGGIVHDFVHTAAEKAGYKLKKSGTTALRETEAYKSALQLEKEKNYKTWEESLKVPNVDTTNNQVIESVFGAGTDADGNPTVINHDQLARAFKENKANLAAQGNKLAESISKDLMSNPAAATQFISLWQDAMSSGNFEKAIKFASDNKLGIKDGAGNLIGNPVKDFADNYQRTNTTIKNEERLLQQTWQNEALALATKEVNADPIKKNWTAAQKEADIKKVAERYIDQYDNSTDAMRMKLPLRQNVDKALATQSSGNNVNYTIVKGGVSLGGEITEADQNYLTMALNNVTKNNNLFELIGQNNDTRNIVGTDTKGRRVAYGDLLTEYNLTAADLVNMNEEGIIEVKGKDPKKQSIKISSSLGIIPEDMPGVGAQSRTLTVQMQKPDENGKYKLETFTFIIPKKSLHLPERVDNIMSAWAPIAQAKSDTKKAEGMFAHNGNQLNNVDQSKVFYNPTIAPEVKIYPNEKGIGNEKGKFVFPDGTVVYGQDGQRAYAEYLKQHGKVSSNYTPRDSNRVLKTEGSSTYKASR